MSDQNKNNNPFNENSEKLNNSSEKDSAAQASNQKDQKDIFKKVLETDPFAQKNKPKNPFDAPIGQKKSLNDTDSIETVLEKKSNNPFSKENRKVSKETPKENVIDKIDKTVEQTQPKEKTLHIKEDTNQQKPTNTKSIPEKKVEPIPKIEAKEKPVEKKENVRAPQLPTKPKIILDKGANKKNLPSKKLLFGFLGLGGIFIGLFYIMLFWGTLSGNASNPLFETLGMDADGLKTLLLTMTNTLLGIGALVLLITTLTFLFRGLMSDKNATDRRNIFTTTGIYFIIFILTVGLWTFLYWFISNLNSGPLIKNKKSLIETVPKNVIDLDSPIRVEFDISEKLNSIIPMSQVRQINWDFNEDGIFDASGLNVSHRFIDKGINNGVYSVKASISYFSEKTQNEEVYETIRQVIVNNESVLAVVSSSPESGTYPLTVELSGAESNDPDGEIVWYEWDLDGDGTFELRNETPLVKKTFETVGEHKVVLRVTGTNTDDYDVVEKIIKVKNPEGTLRAEISTDGVTEGYAPLKVTFDGSMSFIKEGKIIRYEWILEGAGEPFVGRKMQKVFRIPGEHVVRLIVENDLGEKHETKKIINILEEDAVADLVITTTPALIGDQEILRGIAPFEITFNAEDSNVKNAFEWQWDFQNDGIVDEFSVAAKHIFRKPGTYDVKLIIVDANEKTHEKIQRVVVERSGIRAKISAVPNAGEVPLQISFDGSGSSTDEGDLVDYIWEFPGAEPIHYGSKISYLFKQIGNFPIKLTILTSSGKVAKTETIVSVRAPNIRSEFIFSPRVGSAPLNVTLNPTSSRGLVKEYLWDFGDGSIKKQYQALPVEHIYKKEGKYTIKLRLVDSNGVVSVSEQVVEVRPARK